LKSAHSYVSKNSFFNGDMQHAVLSPFHIQIQTP
jgi:hypothetical protein